MSAEVTHRNHHESHIAYGTGNHNHHRGRLERDGAAVGYSRCDLGTGPLRACPDEPDPLERLLVKLAEAAARQPVVGILPSRDRCRYGHGAEHQTWNSQHHPICVECRRLASMKARMKRSASAIVAAALAA